MVKLNKFILIIVFLLIIATGCTIFSITNIGSVKILKGISINGIDVSNMTKEEAISTLNKLVDSKMESNIKIYYDENIEETQNDEISYETNIDISILGAEYDINSVVNEAYNIGKTGNILENNFSILNVLINKKDIKLKVSVNEESLSKTISNISSNLPNKLVQSSYYIEGDKLIITKGISGNILKENEFKEELFRNIK